jgi:hypothetical protein
MMWMVNDQELEAVTHLAPEARYELAGGRHDIPVIVLPGGRVLVEPTDRELEGALASTSF